MEPSIQNYIESLISRFETIKETNPELAEAIDHDIALAQEALELANSEERDAERRVQNTELDMRRAQADLIRAQARKTNAEAALLENNI